MIKKNDTALYNGICVKVKSIPNDNCNTFIVESLDGEKYFRKEYSPVLAGWLPSNVVEVEKDELVKIRIK